MSDLRYDPVFDCWTAVAENRRDRPIEFVPNEQLRKQLICPFCAGNEEETPPPLAILDRASQPISNLSSPNWLARVFANRYPTFSSVATPEPMAAGPYQRRDGGGTQELVIPTPRHIASLGALETDELETGLVAAQLRIENMRRTAGLLHAALFCNCRFEAGASIEHVHFQLIGSPLVSHWMQSRVDRLNHFQSESGASLLDSIAQFEIGEQKRIVGQNRNWVMFCPFASRMPFQAWLVPVNGAVSFSSSNREQLRDLAELTIRHVKRLEELLGVPGYNWILHQSPFADEKAGQWFVEIVPRLAKSAGYEIGTDVWVNPVSPETAARRLK